MVNLYATTPELWPKEANRILGLKNISKKELRKTFQKVIFPKCQEYNFYRIFYESQNIELPLFIIVIQCHNEIQHALDLLKTYSITVRVINGRHSTVIMNPDFYIDMSHVDGISFKNQNELRVQGGATQGQVYQFLFEPNGYVTGLAKMITLNHFFSKFADVSYAFPGGSQGSVGITGVTTNGGLGSFKRTLGLAIDYVFSFRIVLPPNDKFPARLVNCSADENNDLFWALRGCVAQNFGIVVDITYKITRINQILLYFLDFEWKDAQDVITLWQQNAPTRPPSFNEDLNLYAYKKNEWQEKGINISGQYVLSDGETVEQAQERVRDELHVFIQMSTKYSTSLQTYEQTVKELSAGRVYYPFSHQCGILSSILIDAITIVHYIEEAVKVEGLHYYLLELLGGKISQFSPEETAFYPRNATIWYDVSTFYTSVVDASTNKELFEKGFNMTYQANNLNNSVFAGLPKNGLKDHVMAYYGTNAQRLLDIKKKYDPQSYLIFPSGLIE